jgi:hypothetical protein
VKIRRVVKPQTNKKKSEHEEVGYAKAMNSYFYRKIDMVPKLEEVYEMFDDLAENLEEQF